MEHEAETTPKFPPMDEANTQGNIGGQHDSDGEMEFTGEDKIDHTPNDETVRFYTGNAFDIVGERRRTNFRSNSSERWLDESFEIKVRNHKKTPLKCE